MERSDDNKIESQKEKDEKKFLRKSSFFQTNPPFQPSDSPKYDEKTGNDCSCKDWGANKDTSKGNPGVAPPSYFIQTPTFPMVSFLGCAGKILPYSSYSRPVILKTFFTIASGLFMGGILRETRQLKKMVQTSPPK